MKNNNKRKGEKCQGILRKSSQWCNWDMKGKKGSEEKEKEKEEKRGKRDRNSGKGRVTDDKFK